MQAPKMPDWLSASQKAEWKRIIEELTEAGTLARTDRALIESYVRAWSGQLAAQAALERDGYTITSDSGAVKSHPAADTALRYGVAVMNALNAMGLTPAARKRLGKDAPQIADDDPGEAFFKKRGKA